MAANFVVKRTDVLWLNRQDEVFAEIAKLLGVEKADTQTKGWFNKRMRAMGNIIERMSDEETDALDKEAARILREGYSVEQKHKSVPVPMPHMLSLTASFTFSDWRRNIVLQDFTEWRRTIGLKWG